MGEIQKVVSGKRTEDNWLDLTITQESGRGEDPGERVGDWRPKTLKGFLRETGIPFKHGRNPKEWEQENFWGAGLEIKCGGDVWGGKVKAKL